MAEHRPWEPRIEPLPLLNPFEPSTEWTKQLGAGKRVEIEDEEEAVDSAPTDPAEAAPVDPQPDPIEVPTALPARGTSDSPAIPAARSEAYLDPSVPNQTSTKTLRGNKPSAIVTRNGAYIGPDRRQSMIAEAAYYRSEHRGFNPGHELDDWLVAEGQIDAALGLEGMQTVAGPWVAHKIGT